MPWIIYDPERAEAAGCDMELGQMLFAMTVGDLAEVYQGHIDDELEQERKDGSICHWEQLSDEHRRAHVEAATWWIGRHMTNWDEGIRDTFEQVQNQLEAESTKEDQE